MPFDAGIIFSFFSRQHQELTVANPRSREPQALLQSDEQRVAAAVGRSIRVQKCSNICYGKKPLFPGNTTMEEWMKYEPGVSAIFANISCDCPATRMMFVRAKAEEGEA